MKIKCLLFVLFIFFLISLPSFAMEAVSDLKASSDYGQIRLSWNYELPVDGFIIYRQLPGESSMSYRYMVSGQSFLDSTASQEGYNFYRVYPYQITDGLRSVGPSNTYVYAKTLVLPEILKSPVTNLKAIGDYQQTVRLSWTGVDGVDGYIIYRKVGAEPFSYRYMVTGQSFIDTSASEDEYNFYRVYPYKNINGRNQLGPSETYVYATAKKLSLAAVSNIKASSKVNHVSLTWETAAGADGYIIYRKIGNGDFAYRYMVSGTGFNDYTASKHDFNFYRIYPYVNTTSGRLLGSSNSYAYAKALFSPPPAISKLTINRTPKGYLKLTWTASAGADGFYVYRKINDGKWTFQYSTNNLFYTNQAVTPGTTYSYQVFPYWTVEGLTVRQTNSPVVTGKP